MVFQNKYAKSSTSSLKPLKSPELLTCMAGVYLHESATISQSHPRFGKHANAQCTAIATFSVAAMSVIAPSDVSRELLDKIVIDGDDYYADCKRVNNVAEQHLSPEDLLTSFLVFGDECHISIDQIGEGELTSQHLLDDITRSVTRCGDVHEKKSGKNGFLFIAHGKTVAFLVPQATQKSFFLFNSHNVDRNNRFPTKRCEKGMARLFRCVNAASLAMSLVADSPRCNGFWQIYMITVIIEGS